MNEYDGTLIAVEGIDGAGTSTLVNNLRNEYGDDDRFYFTREPSDGYYGKVIRRRLARDDEPDAADFYAFLADRCDHCENTIRPLLEEGKVVITDRYDVSTYAYQSKVLDEELGIIDPMSYIDEMSYHFTVEPDVYLYLRISVEEAMDRIDTEHKYEKKDRLQEASRIYNWFADTNENVKEIPGVWDAEGIFEESKIIIENTIND